MTKLLLGLFLDYFDLRGGRHLKLLLDCQLQDSRRASFDWKVVVISRAKTCKFHGHALVGALKSCWLLDVLVLAMFIRQRCLELALVQVALISRKIMESSGLPVVPVQHVCPLIAASSSFRGTSSSGPSPGSPVQLEGHVVALQSAC